MSIVYQTRFYIVSEHLFAYFNFDQLIASFTSKLGPQLQLAMWSIYICSIVENMKTDKNFITYWIFSLRKIETSCNQTNKQLCFSHKK